MNKLTELQERSFLKFYLELGELGLAYRSVKPKTKEHSAEQLGSKLYKRLLNEVEFKGLFEKLGFTDLHLAKGFVEGANAMRTISAMVIVKSDDPKIRTKQANARDVDFIDVPDYATRHKYLESIAKIKKVLADVENGNSQLTLIFAPSSSFKLHKQNEIKLKNE